MCVLMESYEERSHILIHLKMRTELLEYSQILNEYI